MGGSVDGNRTEKELWGEGERFTGSFQDPLNMDCQFLFNTANPGQWVLIGFFRDRSIYGDIIQAPLIARQGLDDGFIDFFLPHQRIGDQFKITFPDLAAIFGIEAMLIILGSDNEENILRDGGSKITDGQFLIPLHKQIETEGHLVKLGVHN